MKRIVCGLLLGGVMGMAQTPMSQPAPQANSADGWLAPKDAADYLKAAQPMYDYKGFGAWHLVAPYQLFDDAGKPTIVGKFEYWNDGKGNDRRTWSEGANVYSRWNTADGKHWGVEQGKIDAVARRVEMLLLNPFLEAGRISSDDSTFMQKPIRFGKVKFDCKMVIPRKGAGDPQMGDYPTYCFDLDKPILRAVSGGGNDSTIYEQVVVGGRYYFPKDFLVSDQDKNRLEVTSTTLARLSAADGAALKPDADAKPVALRVTVPAREMSDLVLHKEEPVYPDEAKGLRLGGNVEMDATIGADGAVKEVRVVSASSKMLVDAAIEAVEKWRYKPYLLNGQPAEVETTITIKFRMR